MASKILSDFQPLRRHAEASLKGQKLFEPLLKLVKSASKLESSMSALDKAINSSDAAKARTCLSDFLRNTGLYRAHIAAEVIKLRKRRNEIEGGEHNPAFPPILTLLHHVQSLEVHVPTTVRELVAEEGKHATPKMELTGLYGDWVVLKKAFEAETGKKKPSATFLKAFRSSSGLETAFKAVDMATKKSDLKTLEKAVELLDKKFTAYVRLVHDQQQTMLQEQEEGDEPQHPHDYDYEACLTRMMQGLNQCRNVAHQVLTHARLDAKK